MSKHTFTSDNHESHQRIISPERFGACCSQVKKSSTNRSRRQNKTRTLGTQPIIVSEAWSVPQSLASVNALAFKIQLYYLHVLANMSEIAVLRTPSPKGRSRSDSIVPVDASFHNVVDKALEDHYRSPPLNAAGSLTPPPSSQPAKPMIKPGRGLTSKRKHSLTSPPDTLKPGPLILPGGLFGEIPTLDSIKHLDEGELRNLLGDLLPALGEARMSAAHSKLQHSLLSIENTEAAQRAEVEHELTKREVQVLQAGSDTRQGKSGQKERLARPSRSSMQRHLDLALKQCRILQDENAVQERRLRQAKKLILQLDDKTSMLTEENGLLRQRIKQNRDHLNSMRSSGAISINGTPFTEFGTPPQKHLPRTPRTARSDHLVNTHVSSQNPLDALVFAGQVLNGETASVSVPATPTRSRPSKVHTNHIRGAHSLSSLPTTPVRSRPITADHTLRTPVNQIAAESHISFSAPNTTFAYDEGEDRRLDDRDSTISASENEEEAIIDYNVPASQASQRATNILRRSSGSRREDTLVLDQPRGPKAYTQGKIYGLVKKPGEIKPESQIKRAGDIDNYDELARGSKRARMGDLARDRVGLGIASVPSPGH